MELGSVQKQPLETIIRHQILPRSLMLVVAMSLLLLIISAGLVHYQVDKKHMNHAKEFVQYFNEGLDSLQQQVVNLAKNDLIINSIIDDSNRDAYLPVFFRSLELTVTEDVAIVFTDFSGKVITGKNIPLYQEHQAKFDWKPRVLETASTSLQFSENGILIASPILYADYAEGAIVTYVKSLQSAVKHGFDEQLVVFVNAENKVLYSSNPKIAQPGTAFSSFDSLQWFQRAIRFGGNRVVSMEPLSAAYRDMLWLISLILITLFTVLIASIYSTRLSARMASDLLTKLQHSISSISSGTGTYSDVKAIDNEPLEFEAIRNTYDEVLGTLAKTAISRDRFEDLINSLDEVLMVIDTNGKLIVGNRSLEQFLEAAGFTMPEDLDKVLPKTFLLQYSNQGSEIEITYDEVKPDKNNLGNTCIIHWAKSDYLNDEGQVFGTVFIGTDVTKAKRLESELLVKSKAIDEAHTSIVIADLNEKDKAITYVNKAFVKLTGYSENETIGRNCRFLQGPNTQPESIAAIRKAIAEEVPATVTLLNYRKDGTSFYNQLTLSPIFNDKGVATHILGLQTDVTAQENAAAYLKQAKQKAEESAHLKSDFLASMSHEIRTPMNGVIGMLSLLIDSELSSQQQRHAALAKSSADSLLNIINDILDFSKIEAGKLDLDPIEFNLVHQLGETVESVAPKASEKRVEVILDTSDIEMHQVVGDPGRLRQVVTNLISNAIKFTDKGSVLIKTQLREEGDDLRFYCFVKDNGIGIEEDRLEHIFDSFTQADSSTTRKFGGTGLGLAICKQLVELMQGSISVESTLGEGSQFNFDIRLRKSTQENRVLPKAEVRGTTMLVVDDNAINREALCCQLERWGAKVLVASGGSEALDILAQQKVDVALLDYQMPQISGDDLGKQIRKNRDYDACKLILMTSISQRGDANYFAEIGFNAYFPKPTTMEALYKALQICIDGGEIMQQAKPLVTSHYIRELQHHEDERLPIASRRPVREEVTVLLVEDNYTNQVLAETLLQRMGYDSETAEDGEKALEMLTAAGPDYYGLVLMDCQMPVMDGFEATCQIRKGKAGVSYQEVPIIAMTANAIKGDREKCLASGMDDYISKPVDPTILNEKLQEWAPLANPVSNASEAKTKTNAVQNGVLNDNNDAVTSPVKSQQTTEAKKDEGALSDWDKEQAIERLYGNEELLQAVTEAFLKDTPDLVDQLCVAIQKKNEEQVKYLAHTIKGVCANISANALSDTAKKIEFAIREDHAEKLDALWLEFNEQQQALMTLLTAYHETLKR